MNKSDFIAAISEKINLKKKDVELTVNTFWDIVTEQLAKGETVTFVGAGTFTTKQRPARIGRMDPHDTGRSCLLPTISKLSAAGRLRRSLQGRIHGGFVLVGSKQLPLQCLTVMTSVKIKIAAYFLDLANLALL